MSAIFSAQIFFVIFRETLEASIIISVLLSFLNQGLRRSDQETRIYRKFVWQVWVGSILGVFLCLLFGGIFVGVFYALGNKIWSTSEDLWEGLFSLVACFMITVMGVTMLRLNKMKEKWRIKLAKAILESENTECKTLSQRLNPFQWSKKYMFGILPFITTVREGLEAVVFLGGVTLGTPISAFPVSVLTGVGSGAIIGFAIYHGSNIMSIQIFLIVSTCFLYLISAALFSRSIWYFEMYRFSLKVGADVAETGSGPGSYNIKQSVWHVNCCNPETDNVWQIFNAVFGWQNSATYGSVISYNLYWVFVICFFVSLLYSEELGYVSFLGRVARRDPIPETDELVHMAEKATTVNCRLAVIEDEYNINNKTIN